MPGGIEGLLVGIEKICMEVRRGDIPSSEEDRIVSPFYQGRGGFIKKLLSGDGGGIPPDHLFKAHELLILRGRYRICLEPLQRIASSSGIRDLVLKLALARAGNAALDHSIPLDMEPIVSALGLSERSAPGRRSGKKVDPLLNVEMKMLASRLLEASARNVESDNLARGMSKGMFRYIGMAISSAEELVSIDAGIGAYHLARCGMIEAEQHLGLGDYASAQRGFASALETARRSGFPYLEIRALNVLARTVESEDEGADLLRRAAELSKNIRNGTEEARAYVELHETECIIAEGDRSGAKMIMARKARSMDDAAKGLLPDDPGSYTEARARAALWMARADDYGGGANAVREALDHLKRHPDEDIECALLSTAVLIHMRSGDRRRAKRALLDLIARRPVKNHHEAFMILKEAVSGQDWLRSDPDTSELFDEEIAYSIDRSAVEEIIRRARDAFPNEFGAMLLGIPYITHIEPVLEGAGGKTSFMFSLFNRLSQRAVQGEGVVHSHPSGSARPSKADLSMFSRFPGINLIIGYPFSEDSIAAYDRLGNRVKLKIVDQAVYEQI